MICFSLIVLLEQRKDQAQAVLLEDWLTWLCEVSSDRLLPIDSQKAILCTALYVPNPRPQFDSLIAATAHDLTLVTRNSRELVGIEGLRMVNPFSE